MRLFSLCTFVRFETMILRSIRFDIRKPFPTVDRKKTFQRIFTRDDVVSQRLKFGSVFLSSSWKSKIALLFGRGPNRVMETACFDANVQ